MAVSFAVCLSLGAGASTIPSRRHIAVVLDDESPQTRKSVSQGIVALGGRVLHTLGEVLVIEIPRGAELPVYHLAGIREVVLNGVPGSALRRDGASYGLAAWNAIVRGVVSVDSDGDVPEPIDADALVPPHVSSDAVRAAGRGLTSRLGASLLWSAPFGATELTTSEFLAGSVSVNVILVESDGSLEMSSENWSLTRENEVVARIVSGLDWVRSQEPQAALSFVYHVIPGRTDARSRTGYEPIRRAADPGGTTGEDRWVKEILGKLGYASGDRFARSRALASDTRLADGTDWAVNIFVVDSLVDADGKFADGRFAYCWIGGPHLVMTYDNQTWGISRMDMVARHEFLHAFYAFDEYAASGCTCTDHRGYLDGLNSNCEACAFPAQACVMVQNGDAMCEATRRQLGWADLDGDGAIDVIGQDPDTFLDPVPAAVCAPPALTGFASVIAATNRNTFAGTSHPSISVNAIANVEYRVDGSPWECAPGQLNVGDTEVAQRRFRLTLADIAPGPHDVEVRAVDDAGNRDQDPARAQLALFIPVDPLGNSLRAARTMAGTVMTWEACAGATSYRVYRRASPTGPDNLVAETTLPAWADSIAATGYFVIRPVDACGSERPE